MTLIPLKDAILAYLSNFLYKKVYLNLNKYNNIDILGAIQVKIIIIIMVNRMQLKILSFSLHKKIIVIRKVIVITFKCKTRKLIVAIKLFFHKNSARMYKLGNLVALISCSSWIFKYNSNSSCSSSRVIIFQVQIKTLIMGKY